MTAPAWLSESGEGIIVHIYVQPNASKNEIVGEFGSPPRLKIRINAPPIEDKANDTLLRFLKKLLDSARVRMVRGEKTRQKTVLISGCPMDFVLGKLTSYS